VRDANARPTNQCKENNSTVQEPTQITMEASCKDEILRIHCFFVDWLNGTVPNTDEMFDTNCGAVLADKLILIKTNGKVIHHDALQKDLRHAHGSKKGLFFDMEIHNVVVVQQPSQYSCLVMYEEWHYGRKTGHAEEATSLLYDKRICTALFQKKEDTPSGVEWLHIHETSIETT
jgi:hypothetical protein